MDRATKRARRDLIDSAGLQWASSSGKMNFWEQMSTAYLKGSQCMSIDCLVMLCYIHA